jgi:nucleoside-diphosphate-sugar epimerase
LKGQDAVVSAVGTEGLPGQNTVIDAAVAAGVKRFLPSEFGSDLSNPKPKALPVFGYKVAVAAHIEEVASKNPKFSYTYVRNGPFLDWGLEHNFLLDLASGKPRIFDGGNQIFSTTTLESVGRAVVGVLSKPDETKNRAVYVQDLTTSQNRLLALAKEIAPEKSFEPVPINLDDVLRSSNEKLSKGEVTMEVMVGYLHVAIFKEGYGGKIEKDDNELLGLGLKTEEDIKAILRKLLKK